MHKQIPLPLPQPNRVHLTPLQKQVLRCRAQGRLMYGCVTVLLKAEKRLQDLALLDGDGFATAAGLKVLKEIP